MGTEASVFSRLQGAPTHYPTPVGAPCRREQLKRGNRGRDPLLQPLARQRWHLVGTRLYFQITYQPNTALLVQGCMNLFDNGKDVSS